MSAANVRMALVLGAVLGCGDPGHPGSPADDEVDERDVAAWPRPGDTPSDAEAWLFFAVLGEFPAERGELPQDEYRSAGAVRGFEVRTFRGAQLEELVDGWLAGPVGAELERNDVELLQAIRDAPECLALDVRVPDADDFDHLRNAIGLVTWFTDLGGVAVIDPQVLRAWSPAEWRSEVFAAGIDAVPGSVELFWSSEDDAPGMPRSVDRSSVDLPESGSVWVRSRGLRKFARPDVSLHDVPVERFDEAVRFLRTLADAQVDGAMLPTGDAVELPGRAQPVRCTPAGDLDDPDFINVHLRIEW